MAGTAYSYSGLGTQLFKIVYDGQDIKSAIAENFQLEGMFNKFKGEPTGGQYWEFEILTQWPSSAGAMAFNGTVRDANTAAYVNGKVYARQLHGTYMIEKAAMDLSKSKPQAFASVMEEGKKRLVQKLRDVRVKQYLGGNAGTLALCNGAAGPTKTVAVHGMLGQMLGDGTTPITAGAEVFRVGDEIVVDPSGTPQYSSVAAVDTSAGTITTNDNITYTDGMAICYGESGTNMDYGNSMNGLYDLYNASAAYEGIDPSTTPVWAPLVYNGASAGTVEPLSSRHISRLILLPETQRGAKIDVIAGNSNMIQNFMEYFEGQVDYLPGEYKGGMQVLEWNLMGRKVKFVFDPQFAHNTLWGIPTEDCLKFVANDGEWLSDDGTELKWVASKTQFMAVWYELRNFGTRMRNHFAMQRDIEELL